MKQKNIPITSLKTLDEIVEIRPVNEVIVSRYRQAMRSGAVFPPLLVDQDNAVIGGNHRFSAYYAEFGDKAVVSCVVKKYANLAERIEDAVRDNLTHGHQMDGITRRRAIIRLAELGRDVDELARLLGISVARVEKVADMTVIVRGKGAPDRRMPIKRGLEHLQGKVVKAEEYESHKVADRGIPFASLCNQIVRWINNGWADTQDERVRAALDDLRAALKQI